MAGQWIPPNERSQFATAFLGTSIGVGVFYPFFGYILSIATWEWVFHLSGLIGIVWSIAWVYLVYDSPDEHPRINPIERDYINAALGDSVHKQNNRSEIQIPWKHIFQDRAFWMIVVAEWAGVWGVYTMQMQTPTFFNNIHGLNIRTNGLLTGLPYIGRLFFAYGFCAFADYALKSSMISRTIIRKLGGFVALTLQGVFIIAFAYSGCDTILAITYLILATTVHGAVSAGPLANFVDLSPNFAGILAGTCGLINSLPGLLSPMVVAHLTYENVSLI